jgi:hypothetical protein
MKKKAKAIFLKIQRWSSFLPKHRGHQIDQKTLFGSYMTHPTTMAKSLCIRPTMAMLSLAQRTNQSTIERH